jgi:hypothetical protein
MTGFANTVRINYTWWAMTRRLLILAAFVCAGTAAVCLGANADREVLAGLRPAVVAELTATGKLPATNQLSLALGLPLRNPAALEELLHQLYDPASASFHQFLTPPDFTARFGPTEADYEAVVRFVAQHGLAVVGRHANRLVLDVAGSVTNIERAFQVTLRTYRHPTEGREFFAPDVEPSVPAGMPVKDLWGLSDYARPRPLAHSRTAAGLTALNYDGTGPGGAYQGRDFRNAYAPGTGLAGAGQVAAVVEFDGYYVNDITTYEANCGYTNVPLQNVLLNGVSGTPGYSGSANAVAEVSLDIELLIAIAPGLSKVMVYEGSNPYSVLSQMASDNQAKQISCSWAWSRGPSYSWAHGPGNYTLDAVLSQMVAQGQSFFQAAGDSDAYTGSQALSSSKGPIPVDSVYVTSVGGTSLTMNGAGVSWASETVWNWGNNTGTGGGVSPNYPLPWWQTNVSMAANGGSTVNRNIPDVALTADAVQVLYNNGSSGSFGGTSCAAPLWAGFTALVNQQAAALGRAPVGFLNPALYQIAAGPSYSACFHDVTTGSNIGNNTPGLYYAVANYDLATGLGTPNGTNLINALAPPTLPYFLTQPVSQTASNGATVAFSASASGQAPLGYQWRFNGTNLPAGGNASGTTSTTLTLTSITAANAGSYSLVVTNSYGTATSSVATLTVSFPPAFTAQPTNQSVLAGGTALFGATVAGAAPLAYQWRQNGTNLLNGGTIAGAISNVLSVASVTANNAGSYTLLVTNLYGRATSSVATLTVVLPAGIAVPPAPQTVQCGSNASFSVTATGTSPLHYQWSLDGTAIAGATASSLSLSAVHLPNHTVAVVVTNLYGSTTSSALLTVQDTLAPAITLNSTSPYYAELGSAYAEPGATAEDLCAGTVAVSISGIVNTDAVSTNTVTYTANDGSVNTGRATRTVYVRDTTPPTIEWSFTNLVLAANDNCVAALPDVTGTNFIRATDLSGALTLTQIPTTNAVLPLGTNVVVISIADASGNTAYSTNHVLVQDQMPPRLVSQPQNQAGRTGGSASFSVAATACTPLSFQWLFDGAPLPDQTTSVLTLSNLTASVAGNYSAIVTASGGATTSAVAVLTLDVAPSVVLTSSENPSGFKESLAFTATVTPATATGTIEFLTNGTAFDVEPLASGTSTSAALATLPRGTNVVDARYSGDGTFLPASDSLAQTITNHPPVVWPAFYTLVAGTDLNLAVASLATNWSDPDGDTLFIAMLSVSTNGVVVSNTLPSLVYSNPNWVNDQFVCTISDGFGGSVYQAVNITVVPQTNSTPLISTIPSQPGRVTLQLQGAYGSTYVLQSTTNLWLGPWEPVATNTLDITGSWPFTDTQVTNYTRRFYRLMLAP